MTVRPEIPLHEKATTVENAEIAVVGGAGHVGIPLVPALAEAGMRVNVNDLNRELLDVLQDGRLQLTAKSAGVDYHRVLTAMPSYPR
jgi:UDP-N-acetyl-D-mannosaminuronate dehydrogenase